MPFSARKSLNLLRFFTGAFLMFALGILVFPPVEAQALLLEFPVQNYSNNSFPDYTASGIIRMDKNGNVYTFSSLNYPSAPATRIKLSPDVPGARILQQSFQQVVFNQNPCVNIPILGPICGGARVVSNVKVYHYTNPYAFSIDGQVDAAALTATAKLVPKESDIHVQIEVESHIEFLGLFNSLPDAVKNPLLAAANTVLNQFGDGKIDIQSTVTSFDPALINTTIQDFPGIRKVTIHWEDLELRFTDPSIHLDGSVTLNALTSALTYLGADVDGLISSTLTDAFTNGSPCQNNTPVPVGGSENCIRAPEEEFSFRILGDNANGPAPGLVPEPSVFLLMLFGMAGSLVFRRK